MGSRASAEHSASQSFAAPHWFFLAALSFALFLCLGIAVQHHLTTGFDDHLRSFVHAHSSVRGAQTMLGVSLLGSSNALVPAVLLVIVFLLAHGLRHDAMLLALVMAGEVILESGLKDLFHRVRPEAFFDLRAPASYAFPSGHALASCYFYGAVALIFSRHLLARRWRAVVWVLAVVLVGSIGFSRVYLGVHFPTDVIGGYLAGIGWLAIAMKLVSKRLPPMEEA